MKLEDIKKVLSPISGPLGNITAYFDDIVAPVYQNLLNTFLGKPDKAWWNDIVLRQAKVEQVRQNNPMSLAKSFVVDYFMVINTFYIAKEKNPVPIKPHIK